jgi:hypothetical protein
MRRALLPDENVYSRCDGGTPNPLIAWCTLAGLLGGVLPIEQIRRSALCQSFQAKQNVPMISQDESDGLEPQGYGYYPDQRLPLRSLQTPPAA